MLNNTVEAAQVELSILRDFAKSMSATGGIIGGIGVSVQRVVELVSLQQQCINELSLRIEQLENR